MNTLNPCNNAADGTDIRRLKPLGLTSQSVELSNSIIRYFGNSILKYENTEYKLNQLNSETTQSHIWLSLRCANGKIHIGLGREVFAAMVEPGLCGAALEALEDELLLSVVEVACDRWLSVFESEIGSAVVLTEYRRNKPENIVIGVDIAFSIEVAGLESEELRIVCSESLVAPMIKVLWSFRKEYVSEKHCETVLLTLRSSLGTAEVFHNDLVQLESGDVVLITSPSCNDLNKLRINIGTRHYIIAEYHRNGFRVTSTEEGIIMNELEEQPKNVSPTDRLSVQLDFDIGSAEVPVEELSQLAEGYVLKMNQPADSPVNIRCGEILVGRGELVEIDGKLLAVRVVQLYGQSARKLWKSSQE